METITQPTIQQPAASEEHQCDCGCGCPCCVPTPAGSANETTATQDTAADDDGCHHGAIE